MKKLLYALAGFGFMVSSCADDYLDTMPESSTATGTIVESVENAKMAINGICRMMSTQYLSSQGFNGEGTIKTWYGNYPGNDFQKSNLTGWSPIINSTYMERNTASYDYYPWFYYYKLIVNANAILVNMENMTGSDSDKNFIKAQALTFRAYSYFMMSQLYCYRWVDSNNGASRGLPLRLDLSTGEIAASTLGETYAQIYADLNDAIAAFGSSSKKRAADDNYSPDLSVAYAIYARAALTRQDWANAAKYAALARQGYTLMSNEEFMNSGFNTPNDEWIWSVYDAGDQTIYYYSFFAYQGSNSSAGACRSYPCAISKELYDQIPESDVRRDLWLAPQDEAEFAAITQTNGSLKTSSDFYKRAKADYADKLYSTSSIFAYMQFKHQAKEQPGVGCVNNFRAAEMYLIEAEAKCMMGGSDTDVQNLLIALNKTSGRNPEYTCEKTGADLLAEVKLYRRIELWGEGFDWFDYKRWNEPIVRNKYPEGSFHAQFALTINPADNNKWTWVYPAKECDYNELLQGQYKE
ncbi:MAG: RagB/SusD family nutrient uptake outer membrane protein [Bacteroidaceae bacterium]|nr:RagB/SusD family nutrient uptake outer membrane protein [Bacteroidaceae bacterium]